MTQLPWNKMPSWITLSGVLRDLSPSAPKLLIALLSHADENGSIRMSQPDAAYYAGISVSTAKRSYDELCEMGIIEIIEPRVGRKPALIQVCGVTGDRSSMTGHTRQVMGDTTTGQNGPVLTGHGRQVMHEGSWVTPQTPLDRSWVTPQHTHIGTRVRRKEEREREKISLSGFEEWHEKSRMVFHDDRTRAAFEAFAQIHTPADPDDDRPAQVVAMFITKFPNALKVGWTAAKFVELAEAVATHPNLTPDQALIEINRLDGKSTRMGIQQLDELTDALKTAERGNLHRDRVYGSTKPHSDDEAFVQTARTWKPLDATKLLSRVRESIRQQDEQAVEHHWDRSRGTDALTTLKYDWLGDTGAARHLRSIGIEIAKKNHQQRRATA